MEKGAEAFRTIREAAEIVDVPQHVLRFWETRFSQVRPMKRGGGRRYYRPGDLDLLLGIKMLLYTQGYTIKGVQKLLKDKGVAFVSAIGSGDLTISEALIGENAGEITNKQRREPAQNELFPEDILPEPKSNSSKTASRNFFGFLKHDEEKSSGGALSPSSTLSKDNITLLQKVLFDLIECKRLLDRSR